jgi:hypothetical protein
MGPSRLELAAYEGSLDWSWQHMGKTRLKLAAYGTI